MTGKMCKNSGLGDIDVPAHLFQCRHAEMCKTVGWET